MAGNCPKIMKTNIGNPQKFSINLIKIGKRQKIEQKLRKNVEWEKLESKGEKIPRKSLKIV